MECHKTNYKQVLKDALAVAKRSKWFKGRHLNFSLRKESDHSASAIVYDEHIRLCSIGIEVDDSENIEDCVYRKLVESLLVDALIQKHKEIRLYTVKAESLSDMIEGEYVNVVFHGGDEWLPITRVVMEIDPESKAYYKIIECPYTRFDARTGRSVKESPFYIDINPTLAERNKFFTT